jgi:hypothetical protein
MFVIHFACLIQGENHVPGNYPRNRRRGQHRLDRAHGHRDPARTGKARLVEIPAFQFDSRDAPIVSKSEEVLEEFLLTRCAYHNGNNDRQEVFPSYRNVKRSALIDVNSNVSSLRAYTAPLPYLNCLGSACRRPEDQHGNGGPLLIPVDLLLPNVFYCWMRSTVPPPASTDQLVT